MTLSRTPSPTAGGLTATSAMHLVIAAEKKSRFALSRPRKRSIYSIAYCVYARRAAISAQRIVVGMAKEQEGMGEEGL